MADVNVNSGNKDIIVEKVGPSLFRITTSDGSRNSQVSLNILGMQTVVARLQQSGYQLTPKSMEIYATNTRGSFLVGE